MNGEILHLPKELELAYPNANRAILLCQLFDEEDWQRIRKACEEKGFSFVLKHLKGACTKGTYNDPHWMQAAEREFDTTDFANFLKAKLGLL